MPLPKPSLKARALRYLAAREHSRPELARKLARHAGEDEDVDKLLDELEAAKLLSATRFSESLVHRRAARYGNNRILSELQSHGLEGSAIADLKEGLAADEVERAVAVLQKKYTAPPVDAADRAKRNRFLQQRGFTSQAIRAAMRRAFSDAGGED